jgi:hypothetical protein
MQMVWRSSPAFHPLVQGVSRMYRLIRPVVSAHSALLFAHKPERCPYGHSLARGMPQKISWMPCICEPARKLRARAGGWATCCGAGRAAPRTTGIPGSTSRRIKSATAVPSAGG